MKSLNVFYESELVGVLSVDDEERLSFKYSKVWLLNSTSFPLSIALKLTEEPYGHLPTKAFFENLLPEGGVKESLEAHSATNIRRSKSSEHEASVTKGALCAPPLRCERNK